MQTGGGLTSWAALHPLNHTLCTQRQLWYKLHRTAMRNHTVIMVGGVSVRLEWDAAQMKSDYNPGVSKSRMWSWSGRLRSHVAVGHDGRKGISPVAGHTFVFLFLHLAQTLEECRPEAASWISGILSILSLLGWKLTFWTVPASVTDEPETTSLRITCSD